MALTIGDATMTSDRSAHTAVLLPGARYTWVVSWLPGRHLDHGKAVTAMTIADTTADGGIRPDNEERRRIKNWAAELHLTGSEALDRVAAAPQWGSHPKSVLEFGEVNGIRLVLEDPDPIDLGTDDLDDYYERAYSEQSSFEGTEDDPIDLTWIGKEPPDPITPDPRPFPLKPGDPDPAGHGRTDSSLWLPVPRQRTAAELPTAFIPRQATTPWPADRVPHQAINPGRPSQPRPEPDKQEQPSPEPDRQLDWEAGE